MWPENDCGERVSIWQGPDAWPAWYAACVYCGAPVDISKIVDGAIAETLAAVYGAIEAGASASDVKELCNSVASDLWEVIREQTDDSLAVVELRRLAHEARERSSEAAGEAGESDEREE